MKLKEVSETIFESVKHIDEEGNEYWYARDLQKVLEYKDWRNFCKVIDKAIISSKKSDSTEEVWVVEVNTPIKTGKGKEELIKNYKMSRLACYLIVQNADPNKEVVALGHKYFSYKTRFSEIDEKRIYRRKQVKESNKSLNKIASLKGVKNFDKFTNAGYKGLYNGETANDIAKRKGLRYREDILDNMGSVELGANIFRITQTDDLLNKQKEKSERIATNTHYEVGKEVRNTIKKLGGTMPEDLPTPNRSLKEIKNKV